MDLRIQTIDDFLPNPEEFRAHALSSPFYEIRGPDGELYKNINVRPSNEFEPLLAEKLGRPVKVGYSLLRRNFEGEMPNNAVHSDNSYDQFAAVLYLNTPGQCQGGTAFWKHKGTGFTSFPDESEIRRVGKSPTRVYKQIHQSYNVGDDWEQIHLAEMRFNRLIAYPTKYFHSRWPFSAFGTMPEDARMIVALFFSFLP